MLRSVAPATLTIQSVGITLGLVGIIVLARLDYHLLTFSPWPWYATTIGLLLLTLIFGQITRGSTSWISLGGFNVQTSELAKPLLVVFCATYLSHINHHSLISLVKFLCLMAVPAVLIYIQPDLGSASVIIILSFISLLASGITFKNIGVIVFSFLILIPVVFFTLKPYQRDRLISFIEPARDPLGTGYNAIQSQIAVGSGKLTGRGLGQGTQSHLRFLPERHTDFIFASTIEELGFLGGILIFFAYALLFWACITAARLSDSDTGSIISLGVLCVVLYQVVVNAGMNMGVMPITGITLPFISYGGSSSVSFALLVGLCVSVLIHSHTKAKLLEIR